MVLAWYLDSDPSQPREPHVRDDSAYIGLEELYRKTGVEHFTFPVEGLDENVDFLELKKKRGYSYEDTLDISRDALPDYDQKVKNFYTEHLHEHEEIRFVCKGSGFFDVRDVQDQWVRLHIGVGDLLVLPAGLHHRFTLDKKDHVILRRLFIGSPDWSAKYRAQNNTE